MCVKSILINLSLFLVIKEDVFMSAQINFQCMMFYVDLDSCCEKYPN